QISPCFHLHRDEKSTFVCRSADIRPWLRYDRLLIQLRLNLGGSFRVNGDAVFYYTVVSLLDSAVILSQKLRRLFPNISYTSRGRFLQKYFWGQRLIPSFCALFFQRYQTPRRASQRERLLKLAHLHPPKVLVRN